ncbi:hypothetical protein KBG31_01885, partial [Patescibacteria group bacterium]|nr:hypothetical protein [Patescibacteria group bacterium]
ASETIGAIGKNLSFKVAHFALQNTPPKSASPELKRSPATLLVQIRSLKKGFVFLLEGKIG